MRKKRKLEHTVNGVPKVHLRRFHGMDDAKEIWVAIKTRFGGNANSKKMQKAVLKQQFEAFTISSKESLEKGYDRFQKLLSQLDALGAGVSDEDANHKFLRSLPPAWAVSLDIGERRRILTHYLDQIDDPGFGEMDINWADCYDCHIRLRSLQEDRQNDKSGWKNA
ncbi:hypothetical protein Tco_0533924 [Tanacetum coccineum]